MNLYNADCLPAMRVMKDNHFSLAIIDPQYGIGMDNQYVRVKPNRPNTYIRNGESQYKKGEWDDAPPPPEYFEQLFRVSKNQIIWGANYFCKYLPSGFGWVYWDKQMGDNNFSSGEFAFQSMQVKSSCFSCPSMRVKNTRIHPTQKPVALYKWLLTNYAKPGDTILDTHLGSGSSVIACLEMGFEITGYETDSEYFEAMNERIKQHQSQGRMF